MIPDRAARPLQFEEDVQRFWLVVACAGCSVASEHRSLRVEPASIDVTAEIGAPAPVVPLHVMLQDDDGSERDVTAEARFGLTGTLLGSVAGGMFTSDGVTGGAAVVQIGYGDDGATVPVTVRVHGWRASSPAIADLFAAATPTAVDAHLDPPDGAVLPPDLGALTLAFTAADTDDAHEVTVTAPYLDLAIVTAGSPGPRSIDLLPDEWAAIARTARGGSVALSVASISTSAPAETRVASAQLEIADVDAQSLLAGGRMADTDQPSLWRYDMRTARVTPLFANPAGTCFGCHLAVSSDGARIAAGMVTPAVNQLEGVVLDARTGAQLATSTPAIASPWATAAFDPSGALVTAWQGALAVRDAQTGALQATLAMDDPAAAPAISADGRQLAYVTLDAGFGVAASQPGGNALRIRPFTAQGASAGAPVELVRDGGGVTVPSWSSDGRWIAYGRSTIDPTRVGLLPIGSSAVRTDGSGTTVSLTADPRDQLARWASPVTPGRAGGRPAEPIVWVAVNSTRTGRQQLWLEAFFPERGVVAPAFHLPGQPATFTVLHGPLALP